MPPSVSFVTSGATLSRHAGASTGAQGMFVLYTNTVASVTIAAGASRRAVTLAAPAGSWGAALIVVP